MQYLSRNPLSPQRYAFEFGEVTRSQLTWLQNAFSHRLQPLGFNFFDMLVVDLLHEFELGVWKNLFVHLLRILASVNPALLHTLDRRYVRSACWSCVYSSEAIRFRQVPSFGRDTIRKFRTNISEMKQLAGRDFEDILQVNMFICHCPTPV